MSIGNVIYNSIYRRVFDKCRSCRHNSYCCLMRISTDMEILSCKHWLSRVVYSNTPLPGVDKTERERPIVGMAAMVGDLFRTSSPIPSGSTLIFERADGTRDVRSSMDDAEDAFWKSLAPDVCAKCPAAKACPCDRPCWQLIRDYYHRTFGGGE